MNNQPSAAIENGFTAQLMKSVTPMPTTSPEWQTLALYAVAAAVQDLAGDHRPRAPAPAPQ